MSSFDLGKDNLKKLVLKLALPAMLGQFINVLYGIIDRMYIGNIADIGGVALAGVGICTPVTTLITSFSALIGVGGAPLLAMSLGEKKESKAKRILANSFLALVVLSIIVTLITLIFCSQLLALFGATSTNMTYAKSYLVIYLIGAPFAILALGLNQFITCQGFSSAGMRTMLIGAIINIILDPLFIFTFNMGVAGAAIATVIAQIASFLYTIIFLFGRKTKVKITFGDYSFSLIGRIMVMGLSPFIILATDSIVGISLNSALKLHSGTDADFYLTVATITTSFFQLVTMPLLGISSGTQSVLSYNYGASNIKRVKQSEKYILGLALIFTSTCFILSFFIARPFTSLFSSDPRVTNEVEHMIRIYMLGIIPLSFQYCFIDGLTALAQPKAAAFGSLLRKAVVFGLTWILPLFMSSIGCFYAEPISDYVGAVSSTILFLIVFPKVMHRKDYERLSMEDKYTISE